MAARIPIPLQHTLLKAWHAWAAGAYLVAYLTAGEDTYALHQFAGYALLAAIAVRLLAGMAAPAAGPWRLPRPDIKAAIGWLSVRRGRHPLFALLAAALLAGLGLAAATGALADGLTWFEHPHEAIAEASLWVIFAHIAFVGFMYGGKRWLGRAAAWLAEARAPVASRRNAR
jgi:hypothetical protein